jgi:hypothetical protein
MLQRGTKNQLFSERVAAYIGACFQSEEAKEKHRQGERDRRAVRKREWQIWVSQKDGFSEIVCVECFQPETDPRNPLQFSHNDPATKSFNLSEAIMIGTLHKPQVELEEEARRCSLRHLRCHKIFDNGTVYDSDGIAHGYFGYHHGCRCPTCVAANNKYQRDQYRKDPVAAAKRKRDQRARKKSGIGN